MLTYFQMLLYIHILLCSTWTYQAQMVVSIDNLNITLTSISAVQVVLETNIILWSFLFIIAWQ